MYVFGEEYMKAFVDNAVELPNMCFMMLTVFLCICSSVPKVWH